MAVAAAGAVATTAVTAVLLRPVGDPPPAAPQAASAGVKVVASPVDRRAAADRAAVAKQAEALLESRLDRAGQQESRSFVRPPLRAQRADKTSSLPPRRQSLGGSVTRTAAPASPREIASGLLGSYGWDSGQFSCLEALWTRESGWNPAAENPTSGAYGIPQALPGTKMASAGADWRTNPRTQIAWGLGYIRASYGSPCGAWSHSESYGWY